MAVSVSSQIVTKSTDVTIEPLEDTHQKTRVQRQLKRLRRLSYSGAVCLIVNTAYFAYRIKCSLDSRFHLSSSDAMIAWTFLALELSLAFPDCLAYIGAVGCLKNLRIRSMYRLVGDKVPTVDVLIPCCGENVDVILDTVRAACSLDYPKKRYRVILLDDGNSMHLKHQVGILQKAYWNLFYTSREVNVVTHSKAFNLNHGLCFVETLKTGSSEYVAVLDVDMIPMSHFLRALLPHLLKEPGLAMATSPQYYYNIPDGDPLCQCGNFTFDITALRQDISNKTSCMGTGYILRRSAAEDIGGIPTDQMNEDIMTSLLTHDKGWKTVYVWEPLQWGLVPDTYAGHAKQAMRWASGLTSVALVCTRSDPRLRNLSMGGRLLSALGLWTYVGAAVTLTFAMLFIPVILIFGRPFVASRTSQLPNLLMSSALQISVTWINGLMNAEAAGFRASIWPSYRHPFLAPLQSIGLLESVFAVRRNFTPSGSMLDGQRERESRAPNSFFRRMNLFLGQFGSWLQLFVVMSSIFGATHSISIVLNLDIGPQHRLQKLLVGIAWPSVFVHWMLFIVECWKPLSYAIFPPKIHPREDLLERDPDTKVAYPSDMAKDEERISSSQSFSIMVLAYVIFILTCSWGIRSQ